MTGFLTFLFFVILNYSTQPLWWALIRMSYNYIVTAHKATAVSLSVTGNFTGPDDLNLIQVKGSTLVVGLVTPEGLKPVLDVDVFGRISAIQLFRPQVSSGRGNGWSFKEYAC